MELNVKHMGDCVRFEISGIIDRQGAEALKKSFGELNITELKELVLDFDKVKYISSSGVNKLLFCYENITRNGGKLRIINDTGIFHELLTITKMKTIFNVY